MVVTLGGHIGVLIQQISKKNRTAEFYTDETYPYRDPNCLFSAKFLKKRVVRLTRPKLTQVFLLFATFTI